MFPRPVVEMISSAVPVKVRVPGKSTWFKILLSPLRLLSMKDESANEVLKLRQRIVKIVIVKEEKIYFCISGI